MFSGTYSFLATVANGGRLQNASGFDLIFATDNAGTSPIPYERVTWDATTGAIEFHVQVPTLDASTDTVIYILYGDAGISTDQSNKNGTWDSNFKGVWHFGDGVTLDLTDSTSNANDGTNHGGAAATSLLGGAGGGSIQLVKASSQYVDIGAPASLNLIGPYSLEAQVYADTAISGSGDFRLPVGRLDAGVTNGYLLAVHDSTGFLQSSLYIQQFNGGGNQTSPASDSNNYTAMTNRRATGVADGTNLNFYINEVLHAAIACATFPGTNSNSVNIGRLPGLGVFYWDGRLDEIRISAIARNVDWVTATSNSISSPSTFYAVGSEVPIGGSASIGSFLNRQKLIGGGLY